MMRSRVPDAAQRLISAFTRVFDTLWAVHRGAQTQNRENNPMQSRMGPRSQRSCGLRPGHAIASLADEAYFQQSRARVIEGRERLNRGLVRLGFEVLPSSANFVFARHPAHEGAALAAALRQRAVIVRHFPAPRICDYLRITVGTDGQIDRLLSALSDILSSEPASA